MESEEIEQALLAGASGAVTVLKPALAVAKLVSWGLKTFVKSGDDNLAAFMREETAEAVFRLLPEIERKVKALTDAGVDVKTADVGTATGRFAKAWATAGDPKKRALLEDAFVRSFDREQYESGLLNALWERLDRLHYGDLVLLRDLVEAKGNAEKLREVRGAHGASSWEGLGLFHAENLIREGLAHAEGQKAILGYFKATELGYRMRSLAWSQLPDPT